MARIRSVHPDICVSETMAELPAELERTFTRLLTHCDDEGRCLDIPRLVKAAIYPLHDDITADVLDAEMALLADAGLIWRYEARGKRYIEVCSWGEYQHPQRPKKSKCPPCPRAVRDAYMQKRGHGADGAWTGGEKEDACATDTRDVTDITDITSRLADARAALS